MPTPSIQTLVTDAQQVLNLDSISAVRSVVAVALANANTGTPLNPNLTTQQLWNEFYQVVTKPKSDIESIIANQLMKFLFAPPAPGGVGANKQVIFNDGGVLAGDAGLTYDKATDKLSIVGGLGVGAPPSPWQTGLKAINFSTNGVLYANGGNSAFFGNNYYNDSAGTNRYLTNNVATAYGQVSGAHLWYSAPIGNAGDPLTGANAFVQTMALDASGNLSFPSNKYIGWGNLDTLIYGSSTSNYIYFRTNATEQVRIDGAGNVDVKAGNVIVSSGKGIDFSATPSGSGTMTSELLSDYEEGTFTPIIQGGSSAGTGTYAQQIGYYTKVGRLVTVQLYLVWSAHTGTGAMRIGGLPFITANLTSAYSSATFGLVDNIALNAGAIMTGFTELNSNYINLYQYPSGGGASPAVSMDTAGGLLCNLSYIAA